MQLFFSSFTPCFIPNPNPNSCQFGYAILRPETTDPSSLQYLITKPKLVTAIVQLMIEQYDIIFGSDDANVVTAAASKKAEITAREQILVEHAQG